jgi:hypothetical protein
MYSQCEILFPHSRVRGLKRLRGEEWQSLVERIAALPETHEDALAFSLMMIELCDCMNCDLSSFKAALGCSACSQRMVNATRVSDKAMLKHFEICRETVLEYLNKIGAMASQAA